MAKGFLQVETGEGDWSTKRFITLLIRKKLLMQKVNLREKFNHITEYWKPKIAGELNGQHVKLAKLKGEFIWHRHENEDELFLIIKGKLCLRLRDRDVWLEAGEFFIVPKGVEHKPVAAEEVHLLLFEPISTLNTGDQRHAMTVEELERI